MAAHGPPGLSQVPGPGLHPARTPGGWGEGKGRAPGQAGTGRLLEHGDEEVKQQDVGEEKIEAQQGDRQPLGEGGLPLGRVDLGAFGLVGVGAIGAALVQVEVHACDGSEGPGEPGKPSGSTRVLGR